LTFFHDCGLLDQLKIKRGKSDSELNEFYDALTQLDFSIFKSQEKAKDDSSRLRFLMSLK